MNYSKRSSMRVLACLGVALALFITSAGHASAEHIDRGRQSVLHWNMYGAVGNSGSTPVAEDLLNTVRNRSPLPQAISVNEVCSLQFEHLNRHLGPMGYSGHFGKSLNKAKNCGERQYGNAIFVRGSNGYHDTKQYYSNPDNEKRNYVCAGSGQFGKVYCSTHLATNPSVAHVQANELRTMANNFENFGIRTIIMGDFNLGMSDSAMTAWLLDGWREGDYCRCRQTTKGWFGSKIDYIWSRKPFTHDAYLADTVRSDHRLYQAYPQ